MGGGGDNTPKETAQEKALAEVAAGQYNEYRTKGVPLEDAMIARANTSAPDYEAVAGTANAEVQNAADTVAKQRIATRETNGVNVNSGAAIMGGVRDSNKIAEAGAQAGAKAVQSATDTGLAAKQQMIALGRGQATEAIRSMSEQAATAAGTAIRDKALDSQASNDTGTAIGTGIGMATAAFTRSTDKKKA